MKKLNIGDKVWIAFMSCNEVHEGKLISFCIRKNQYKVEIISLEGFGYIYTYGKSNIWKSKNAALNRLIKNVNVLKKEVVAKLKLIDDIINRLERKKVI